MMRGARLIVSLGGSVPGTSGRILASLRSLLASHGLRDGEGVGRRSRLYSARPMIKPSIPASAATALTSASEPTPPEAITGIVVARAIAAVCLDVRAAFGAVAGDVGVDDGGGAARCYGLGEIGGEDRRGFFPAGDARFAVAGIDADGDPTRKGRAQTFAERGVAHGDRADDRAGGAGVQHGADRGFVAEPAADLHRHSTAWQMRRTTSAWTGAPARAPSRSTTWSQRPPAATQRRAMATGSSP